MSKIFNLIFEELTLLELCIKLVFIENLEDLFDMFEIFFFSTTEDQDVIYVHKYKDIELILEDSCMRS